MKKVFTILVLALLAGVAAFCVMRSHKLAQQNPRVLLDSTPELAWLRADLKLTDQQFVRVSELHADYRPKCVELCHRIGAAHERLEAAARAHGTVSPELKAAIADHAKIHAECQEAMLEHIYNTAAALDEKQAAHYLDTMLPYALDFTHSEPDNAHVR
jgi:hypothetical protein